MDHLSCKSLYKGRFLHFSGEVPTSTEKADQPTKIDQKNLDPQRTKEMGIQVQGRIARTNENRKIEEQERQETLPDIERQMNEAETNTDAPNTEKMSEEKLTSYGNLKLGTALGYRSDKGEGKDLGSDEWIKDHTGKTPKGSLVMGVMHLDKNKPDPDNDAKAKDLLEKKCLPLVGATAMEALKTGKKVTFLTEGKELKNFEEEESNEQRTIAEALDKQFPGQIIQGTWDNEAVNVFTVDEQGQHQSIDRNSPVVEKLALKYGGTVAVEAGLFALLYGEKEELTPSPEATEFLRKEGIKIVLSETSQTDEQIRATLKKAAFEGNGILADVTNDYNRLRQENILQMVNDIESEGGIAIVTPGASHAFSLKGVLKGHMEDIQK